MVECTRGLFVPPANPTPLWNELVVERPEGERGLLPAPVLASDDVWWLAGYKLAAPNRTTPDAENVPPVGFRSNPSERHDRSGLNIDALERMLARLHGAAGEVAVNGTTRYTRPSGPNISRQPLARRAPNTSGRWATESALQAS